MSTVSFKTDDDFKATLEILAKQKGINLSAYIKLLLTHGVMEELNRVTSNGMTVREELEILRSDLEDETYGPFTTVPALMKALRSNRKRK